MAKQYKIKRYKKTGGHTYKARPHPLTILLCIVLIGGLAYLGVVIYQPVYDFVMSIGQDGGDDTDMASSADPGVSAEPPAVSQPDPEPEPEPPKTVDGLTAVFMPFDIAADAAQANAFIDRLDSATNAVMIEIKNSQGQLLYDTKVEQAVTWEAVSDKLIDLNAIIGILKGKNKHLIVRMHAFSDPIAARGDRELNAIKYQNSDMLWLDNYADRGGKPWLNPYVPEVRAYLIEIAKEAVDMGASMVVMDSVRFPDDMTGSASFGAAAQGISRADALISFAGEVEATLTPAGGRFAVYIPATAISQPQRESRYGGNPLAVCQNIVLGILPELLETGYLAEGVTVTRPATDLSKMVQEVLNYAKNQPVTPTANIIPMLGASPAGVVPMTSEKVRIQIDAARESGNDEYILYSANGVYPLEAGTE